jgi:hypothetical protein
MFFNTDDYRQFAQECLEWARKAKTDEMRKHFLDMAKLWSTVAAEQPDTNPASVIPEIVMHHS